VGLSPPKFPMAPELERSLCLQAYAPNSSAMYPEFVEGTSDVLRKVKTNESRIVLGDFNAHGTVHHKQFLPMPRFAQAHLMQGFLGSAVTHWFLHSFSWLVPFNVGRSCQKGVELSFDHHLLVCNLHMEKRTGFTQRCRIKVLPNKVGSQERPLQTI